jgi:hypothetical protein
METHYTEFARGSYMLTAKDILLKPIDSKTANALVKRLHYSGKVVNNSQFHIGVFIDGTLEGVMQFGPSLDKRKIQGLVSGTGWNEFIELNRMAFSEKLPRNSESRAIALAMKILKKHAPHLKWVISFADATQCGDGTIYRASGFVLTGIKKNNQIWVAPDEAGSTESRTSLTDNHSPNEKIRARQILSRVTATKSKNMVNGAASMKVYEEAGFRPLAGFQLRYIYFLDKTSESQLTVDRIPYARIKELGASMYLGRKLALEIGDHRDQRQSGGALPTQGL